MRVNVNFTVKGQVPNDQICCPSHWPVFFPGVGISRALRKIDFSGVCLDAEAPPAVEKRHRRTANTVIVV